MLQLLKLWFLFRIDFTKYSSTKGSYAIGSEEVLSEEGGTEFTDVKWSWRVRGGEDSSKR